MNIVINGSAREVSQGLTIAGLLAELELTGQGIAVEVNLELVPRAQHALHELQDGDKIEVVTLVGGG